jgi:hypothetical protein
MLLGYFVEKQAFFRSLFSPEGMLNRHRDLFSVSLVLTIIRDFQRALVISRRKIAK